MPITRLPDFSLPHATSGAPHSLRGRGREGSVVLLLHAASCEPCAEYLHDLAQLHDRIADWDGRVLVVVPESPEQAAGVRSDFAVVADVDGEAARRCGLDGGGAMVIADQWGEVFFVEAGGEGIHAWPAAEEVVEWLRFMAIQCPECQGEAL